MLTLNLFAYDTWGNARMLETPVKALGTDQAVSSELVHER